MPAERDKVPSEAGDPRKRGQCQGVQEWYPGEHGGGRMWWCPEYTGGEEQQKKGGKKSMDSMS